MKLVIQRVLKASVSVGSPSFRADIGQGLLVLLGVEKGDSIEEAGWLAEKTLNLRLFGDKDKKMDRSVLDVRGQILAISQFTLAGRCDKGRRPSFDKAAPPAEAKRMYEAFCEALAAGGLQTVNRGLFGADMQVALVNDGPVTFILEKRP